jgi:ubiquinone biosynthesis protein Coq4
MWNEARLALAAFRVYRDPDRLDEVLEAATRLAKPHELDRVAGSLCDASPAFASAVRDRYTVKYDLADLARRPAGSLGRAVADHCARWKIDPATFPKRPNETRGDYILVHVENTHDVWHPVCGFESDVVGEIGLQAFYLAQFPNLLGLLLMAIANVHVMTRDARSTYPRLMEEITRGWLLGKRASPLFGVRWDAHWDRPLADVRRELGIDVDGVARIMTVGASGMEKRLAAVA